MPKIIRLLSLDIVLGAVSGSLYFSEILNVHMPWQWWIILPLGVWIIYTADHIFDAVLLTKRTNMNGRRFHFNNRNVLSGWSLVLTILSIVLIIGLPQELIFFLAATALLIVLYLLQVHFSNKHFFVKEPAVAIIYVTGISIAPVFSGNSATPVFVLIVIIYFLIILLNVFIQCRFDYGFKTKFEKHSIAHFISKSSNQNHTHNFCIFSIGINCCYIYNSV